MKNNKELWWPLTKFNFARDAVCHGDSTTRDVDSYHDLVEKNRFIGKDEQLKITIMFCEAGFINDKPNYIWYNYFGEFNKNAASNGWKERFHPRTWYDLPKGVRIENEFIKLLKKYPQA